MTIPAYTPRGEGSPHAIARPPTADLGAPELAPSFWRDPIDRAFSKLRARPRAMQWILDLAGIAFTVLAFASTPFPAEFLFHGVFVVLAIHAFLFGLRGTLIRIGFASLPLLAYANAPALGIAEAPLELSEWPLMFVIAVIVAWMADRRETTSRRYAALFMQAGERLMTVQEDERRRIAGELHDGVGQVLTALTLTLDAARSARDRDAADRHVLLARQLGGTALAETRELAHKMRPARLEERGLVPAIRDLAGRSGFPVRVIARGGSAQRGLLGPTATVEVYRIVQEALANSARHSGAPEAVVTIARTAGRLRIDISDEGRGFDSAGDDEAPGIGLAGMQERAELLGGLLTIASRPERGTRVTLSVPALDPAGGD